MRLATLLLCFCLLGFSQAPDTRQIMLLVQFPFEREDETKMVNGEYGVLHIYLNDTEIQHSPFKVKATSPGHKQLQYVLTHKGDNVINYVVTDSDGRKSRISEDIIRNF